MNPNRKPAVTSSGQGPYEIVAGYRRGALGRVTELHGRYYAEHWAFDRRFEVEVATELADFLAHCEETRDGLWLALEDGEIVGSIAIDGRGADGARLRWFIVASDHQGGGLGRRLLDRALAFCRERGQARVHLATFAGLDQARRLYESRGFRLVREYDDRDWGPRVTHQVFELPL